MMKKIMMFMGLVGTMIYADEIDLHNLPAGHNLTVEEAHGSLKKMLQKPDICDFVTRLVDEGYTSATFELELFGNGLLTYFSGGDDVSLAFLIYWHNLNCAAYNYCVAKNEDERSKVLDKDLRGVAEQFVPIYNKMRKKSLEADDSKK